MHNQSLGKFGEDEAVKYLAARGYRIIERNFKARYNEIDIIAVEKKTLVLVEVKTRIGSTFGLPVESITARKLNTLIRSFQYFKLLHPQLPDAMRIDVVSINISPAKRVEKIELFQNITGG